MHKSCFFLSHPMKVKVKVKVFLSHFLQSIQQWNASRLIFQLIKLAVSNFKAVVAEPNSSCMSSLMIFFRSTNATGFFSLKVDIAKYKS